MTKNGFEGLVERGEALQCLDDKKTKERFGSRMQQSRSHRIRSQPAVEMNSSMPFEAQQQCKKSSHVPQRKNQTKWAYSGPAMQAVFLRPGPKSCGTGVFIPRTEGSGHQFNKIPAFSPVLLPARVIQALNLNVHELGQQIKPQQEQRKDVVRNVDERLEKEEDDVIYISPDIVLPKEWTY